jgi:hypothetical protein
MAVQGSIRTDEDPCFVCYEGFVFLGKMVIGEDGEEHEVIEAVPCRRCAAPAR